MNAVAGGLVAAGLWATAGFCSANFGRRASPFVGVALAHLIGCAIAVPAALVLHGVPTGASAESWGWAGVYGLALGFALVFAFYAVASGPIGLASTIISCEGAIAALIAVAMGERLALAAGLALVAIAIGIVLAVFERTPGGVRAVTGRTRLAVLAGGAAALLFALTLVAGSEATDLDPLWVVAVGRTVSVVTVSVPVLVRSRGPGRPTRLWWLIVANATADVIGYSVFVSASRDSLAIASVLASEYAVLLVLLGALVFRERLAAWQLAGIGLTLAGVGVVAGTQA